jgi:hypothetical protein
MSDEIAKAPDVADRRMEIVARAMCGADGYDSDEIVHVAPRWYSYCGEARRFIAAQRALDAAKQAEKADV